MSAPARRITGAADVAEGAAWLAERDPDLARANALCDPLPLRLRPEGFAELFGIILGQQVSTASAGAIRARCEAAGLVTPEAVLAADDATWRAVGLSRPKQRHVRALAAAEIDHDRLRTLPDEAVIATLMAVPGIGRWTAEVYAMSSLGRPDILAAGDLALRESARLLLGFEARPGEAELRRIATRWSPWRSVAARALWAYYRLEKNREGIR